MLNKDELITINNLNLTLGKTHILKKINFKIYKNEITTLVGPNGAGKSTLLKCMMGSIKNYSGVIKARPYLKIGYVPQKIDFNYSLPITVKRFLNLPEKLCSNKMDKLLSNTETLKLKNYQLNHLSKGELQRVLLAYALKNSPDLLILDEANQGLDHLGLIQFYKRIEDIKKISRCSILLVSHELHIVMAASDRVICLNKHICCEGAPEIVSQTKEYYELFGKQNNGTLAIYHHKENHNNYSESKND